MNESVAGWGTLASGGGHALLWEPTGGTTVTATDLNPTALSGYSTSILFSTDGSSQVGYASGSATGGAIHAMMWNGNAGSAVDLQPTNLTGFTSSAAYGVSGNQQVGYAISTAQHAMLWAGSASTAVDLNPAGFQSSAAYATNGRQQVGTASSGSYTLATLWNGNALNFVILGPPGSSAYGIGGNQQVGTETVGSNPHAMLWTGGVSPAVDLTAGTNEFGVAYATNGTQQVGIAGASGSPQEAAIWTGTAASEVNLGATLPASLVSSQAFEIDPSGVVFGIAQDVAGNNYAVEFVQTPEPTISLVGTACLSGLFARRRRRTGLCC